MEQANTDQANLIKEVSIPVYQARGWMKLIGILMIIAGVFYALTIVGIIIAWLPIWMGVVLYQAGSSSEQAYFNGDKYSLLTSLNKLKLYFTIMGIMTLITIALMVIMLIAVLAGGLAFGDYFDSYDYY
ncbi:MAG: hypothetical protein DRJ15_14050 [Bacteroidetes bacterium]|nr:MAG: hypothetical protein DRI83_09990 [Bacteroidota bacterium]RLD77162.1 MAG: hypothetical protein DRJ15_14050 [Bacteroidota bacterium]